MNRPSILQPGTNYTFSKYFELPLAPADILAEFDCTYERKRLDLPRYEGSIKCLDFLKRILQDIKLYRVPEELEELLRILVGIISSSGDYL
ncbi:hypothetical protein [Brasilonema bromeliae]|uniref:Uncharacterized protein n=1 Tax=Brasilonema bromeliae SPC951 TaxID=385972 RepID=A0ABX1PC78_9CYAN|nr:hypothetical protein [Brasilonema bromeliae]NMG21476.1 hypothetical protein [Brasilonema bromeliae SPC951]